MGIPFGAGQQMLFDAHQKFVRSGLQVFLRVQNYPDVGDFVEVGVPYSPSGTGAASTGYTDFPVKPPPNLQDVSMHNIGLLAGRLNFGSKIFWISDTFVQDQLKLLSAASVVDPIDVFRNRDGNKAIGLIYRSRMFSIEDVSPRETSGTTISWKIVGNALETISDSPVLDVSDEPIIGE